MPHAEDSPCKCRGASISTLRIHGRGPCAGIRLGLSTRAMHHTCPAGQLAAGVDLVQAFQCSSEKAVLSGKTDGTLPTVPRIRGKQPTPLPGERSWGARAPPSRRPIWQGRRCLGQASCAVPEPQPQRPSCSPSEAHSCKSKRTHFMSVREYSAGSMPSSAHPLTPSATPMAPRPALHIQNASSPPLSAWRRRADMHVCVCMCVPQWASATVNQQPSGCTFLTEGLSCQPCQPSESQPQ